MSCCLRNTIGQHRVSIVLPSPMVPMTTRQKYDVVPMSYDDLTMALRMPRCTREFNTKLDHRVSFLYWHVKDFGAARDGDADGLKSLPMDIRWVTMHSRMARCLHDPRRN